VVADRLLQLTNLEDNEICFDILDLVTE
jgi:hypothetical protein